MDEFSLYKMGRDLELSSTETLLEVKVEEISFSMGYSNTEENPPVKMGYVVFL